MLTGDIDAFHWVELVPSGGRGLGDVIRGVARYLLGLRAVNVSWDSGLLLPSDEVPQGWTFAQGRAVSPTIDQSVVDSWPYSGGFDEWYVFSELPANLKLSAYCNWGGLSVGEWADIVNIVPHGMDLRRQLLEARPIAVFGEGHRIFAISTNHELANEFGRTAEGV